MMDVITKLEGWLETDMPELNVASIPEMRAAFPPSLLLSIIKSKWEENRKFQ